MDLITIVNASSFSLSILVWIFELRFDIWLLSISALRVNLSVG